MKIVIELPEEVYDEIMIHNRELREGGKSAYYFEGVIQNGTPLPKGHGDLKDVNKIHLDKFVDCRNYSLHPLHSEDFKRGYNSAIDDVWDVLHEAQTIIEAEKEQGEEEKKQPCGKCIHFNRCWEEREFMYIETDKDGKCPRYKEGAEE